MRLKQEEFPLNSRSLVFATKKKAAKPGGGPQPPGPRGGGKGKGGKDNKGKGKNRSGGGSQNNTPIGQ